MDVIESITPFLSHCVRHFFFSFVMERIIATIYLRKYFISNTILLFWILASQTFFTSVIYGAFLCYSMCLFYLFQLFNHYNLIKFRQICIFHVEANKNVILYNFCNAFYNLYYFFHFIYFK